MRGKRKRPDPTKADAAALAEDLLWSWREEEGDGRGPFRSTLYGLLDADREDAIGLAVRIEAESRPGGVTWFPKYLLEEVEYVFAGSPIRGFRLFVVMITTKGTERPDPADFAECLIDSGFFEYKDRIPSVSPGLVSLRAGLGPALLHGAAPGPRDDRGQAAFRVALRRRERA